MRKTVYQEITACSNLISVSKAKASCLREKEKTVVRWHSKNYNTAIFFCFHFVCHVNQKKKKKKTVSTLMFIFENLIEPAELIYFGS